VTGPEWMLRALAVLCTSLGMGPITRGQVCSATRTLPSGYAPGQAFVVSVVADPDAATKVYGVEDRPPSGWTVSDANHGGVFDGLTGKVKWGFFFDNDPRLLRYTVTPPVEASGRQCFGPGVISCDGVDQAIVGDECIQLGIPTVSEWGLVVMSLLTLAAGTLAIDRRSRTRAKPIIPSPIAAKPLKTMFEPPHS